MSRRWSGEARPEVGFWSWSDEDSEVNCSVHRKRYCTWNEKNYMVLHTVCTMDL